MARRPLNDVVDIFGEQESLVIGLAPGSIIKFDKGCEEMLRLLVGENAVAIGEAVKVGEKFGFRVTSMVMPLLPASRNGASVPAKPHPMPSSARSWSRSVIDVASKSGGAERNGATNPKASAPSFTSNSPRSRLPVSIS